MARANAGHNKANHAMQVDMIGEAAQKPGWYRPQNKKEERKWIEELVDHLYIDPDAQENVAILRFLLMEWRDMKGTIYKSDGIDKVTRRLTELEAVKFLRRNEDTNQYEYWRDYSEAGRLAFMTLATSPTPSSDQDEPIEKPVETETNPSKTTDETVLPAKKDDGDAELTNRNDQHLQQEADSDRTNFVPPTQNPMGKVTPGPLDQHGRDATDINRTTRTSGSTTAAERTTPSEFRQMVAMAPQASMVTTDEDEQHHTTTGTEEEPAFILTQMRNPYTGTLVTVKTTPPRAKVRQTVVTEHQDQPAHKDSEGFFIPVVPRKKTARYKRLTEQEYYDLLGPGVEESKEAESPLDIMNESSTTKEGPPDFRLDTVDKSQGITMTDNPTLRAAEDPTSPYSAVHSFVHDTQDPMQVPPLPSKLNNVDGNHHPAEVVQALNTVLQYKIQEAVRTLDTHQKAWISMIGYREDHIKEQLRKMELQMKAHLVQETEYLKKDMTQMAKTIQRQAMETVQTSIRQKELATQSWMQVESGKVLEKLTTDLQTYQKKHEKHITDFCMEELDELQSNLDGYKAHVTAIHEELRTQCPPLPHNRQAQTIPAEDDATTNRNEDTRRTPSSMEHTMQDQYYAQQPIQDNTKIRVMH